MAENSTIEWTDATWNIITGCTLVDEGCRNCYAAHLIASWPAIGNHPSRKGLARKNAAGEAKFTGEVRFNDAWLDQPLRWKKPRRIFVCAHGDLFHESVPDEWIDWVFAVMALCPQHTFQVLTKRPERMAAYFSRDEDGFMAAEARIEHRSKRIARERGAPVPVGKTLTGTIPWPHVWLGTSVSDQASADLRIPHLLAPPAAVRFLSVEPMLGPVDLTRWIGTQPYIPGASTHEDINGHERQDIGGGIIDGLDWVICGGESGPGARPMHPGWARSLRDQCVRAGTAYFHKQNGEYAWTEREEGDPATLTAYRIGKKAAGRQLDGQTWDQMPGVKHG